MATLLELHSQHFNVRLGTFNSKPFAAIVAERIREFVSRHVGHNIDSRSVQVVGKHQTFTIEMPRIRHVWWPKSNSDEGLGAELFDVASAFKETLNGQD